MALPKRGGNIRLIESPKPRLKKLQRQILSQILDRIPVHGAAHGFVKGRSIKSFAGPHAGRWVVVRMDMEVLFPAVSGASVRTLFRTAGYPEQVADLLGGICTNATPARGVEWCRRSGLGDAPGSVRSAAFALRARPGSPALANTLHLSRRLQDGRTGEGSR